MTTKENTKFNNPIPGISSSKPNRIEDIKLIEVARYHFEAEDISKNNNPFHNTHPAIQNADPYAMDYYDSLIQIKHHTNSLCNEFLAMGIYTEKQLNAIYLKNDSLSLFTTILNSRPIIESGVFRNFKLSHSYALKVSRETVELIKKYRDIILRGKIAGNDTTWMLMPQHYFKCLRYIYTNIGKMEALVCYFENLQIKAQQSESLPPSSNRIQYQTEVKRILIDLLAKQSFAQNKKFNTISAAVKAIKPEFESQYEILKTKNLDQQYFHIDHLVRNIQTFQRKDNEFKKAISDFIVIKH